MTFSWTWILFCQSMSECIINKWAPRLKGKKFVRLFEIACRTWDYQLKNTVSRPNIETKINAHTCCFLDDVSEKRNSLSYVIINPSCDLTLEEGDVVYIIRPSPIKTKKTFLTRGNSTRSKVSLNIKSNAKTCSTLDTNFLQSENSGC